MSEYTDMLDEEHNEIMQEVRACQAEAWAIRKRFEGDPEGYRRWEETDLARFGYRLEPMGDDGTARLVRIAG